MSHKEYTNVIMKAREQKLNVSIKKLNEAINTYSYEYIINNLEKFC